MTWKEIEQLLINDIREIHTEIKELAPYNSSYKGMHDGALVDYIFVDYTPTYTNTNNLYNSVSLRENNIGGNNREYETYVSSSRVPYYRRAVLGSTLPVVEKIYGRDYNPSVPVNTGENISSVPNRNYMYYMKAEGKARGILSNWNGRTYRVSDGIGDFE